MDARRRDQSLSLPTWTSTPPCLAVCVYVCTCPPLLSYHRCRCRRDPLYAHVMCRPIASMGLMTLTTHTYTMTVTRCHGSDPPVILHLHMIRDEMRPQCATLNLTFLTPLPCAPPKTQSLIMCSCVVPACMCDAEVLTYCVYHQRHCDDAPGFRRQCRPSYCLRVVVVTATGLCAHDCVLCGYYH